MRSILFMCLLLQLALSVSVTDADKCSSCKEFQSQHDCESTSNTCQWVNSKCAERTMLPSTYCESIPESQCSKTLGCAYISSKCTHFTGCTSYNKTTVQECQTISYQCTTNGVTCDDVPPCSENSLEICESMPSSVSPYKCKLDGENCREPQCKDADTSLSTNQDCNAWMKGCVTTGYGCIDTLPNCSTYSGQIDTCDKMVGKDGKCTLDPTTFPLLCKVRVCYEASFTIWSDEICNNYQQGCKSTGFSCEEYLQSCSTYKGNQLSCLNYMGIDGQCTADATSTQCRARRCEDKISAILSECTEYLSGCKTNGVACVTNIGNCRTIQGTATTCSKQVGTDGNCKGSNDTVDSCSVKTCEDDDLGTEATDEACQLIQSWCKSTGQGCVSFLQSCSSYKNDGNCLKYIGLEGKCKAGVNTCEVRICSDNTTATTNEECQSYKLGCVTNGLGCVIEATCAETVSKLQCLGTTNNYQCGWIGSCIEKDCTAFSSNKSQCSNAKLNDYQPCIWKSNKCFEAKCGDYIEIDDVKCDNNMKGCVTNGKKCANPKNCDEFQGTMTMCRGFIKAQCTNLNDSIEITTKCISRNCDDNNINALSDNDCQNYLQSCLYAGSNKCISNSLDCSYYQGTSTDECSKFTGFGSPRPPCWWISDSNCVTRECALAKEMKSNTDCETFMAGCIFDGNDSCVDSKSDCTKLKYKIESNECQNLSGVNGTQSCYDGINGYCKKRECSDAPSTDNFDTDQECKAFLSGCLTKGLGCITATAECDQYSGTSLQCSAFKGNQKPCYRKQKCITSTTPPPPCSNKIDAISNNQCNLYNSNCVLKFETNNCIDQVTNCSDYILNLSAEVNDKITYCNTVKTTNGQFCAYDPFMIENCVTRTCALWNSAIKVGCSGYAGKSVCSYVNGVCHLPQICEFYTIPNEEIDKVKYCNNFRNKKNKQCTYDSKIFTNTCKTINKCEEAYLPLVQDDCYIQTGQSNCFLVGKTCITIQNACANYDITEVNNVQRNLVCKRLNVINNGLISQCKYVSGTNCADDLCEEIFNPQSQNDCNSKIGCKYYLTSCYTIKQCQLYTIPDSITDDTQKNQFCQNMYNHGSSQFCSFTIGQSTCSSPKSCNDYNGLSAMIGSTNLTFCKSKRDKTSGVLCTYIDNATACSTAISSDICTIDTDQDCDLLTVPKACQNVNGSCKLNEVCSLGVAGTGTELLDCQALTGPDGYYCTYFSGANCIDAPDDCSSISGTQLNDCTIYINKYGTKCTWMYGDTNCSNPIIAQTCGNVFSPSSQVDCDLVSKGCIYFSDSCIKNAETCSSYSVSDLNQVDALKYCNGRVTISGEYCTFTDQSTQCSRLAACHTYNVVDTEFAANFQFCQQLQTTDNYSCVYVSGSYCQEIADQCDFYTVTKASDCTFLMDTMGRPCQGITKTCSYKDCSTITNPKSQNDCDSQVLGCLYYSIAPNACSKYTTGGLSAKTYCDGLKDSNGMQCFATADSDLVCQTWSCDDYAAQFLRTNKECQDYSITCKSNGLGCVTILETCSSFYGDSKICSQYLDETGQKMCEGDALATDIDTCASLECKTNVTATSQQECDSFIVGGNCKFSNPGCVDKTIPCYNYRGTQTECSNFIGNGIKCYGDLTIRSACRDLQCTDKTFASNDADCEAFPSGCVFNGIGCINQSSSCNAFQGPNATCKNFKGMNGSTLCWSTSQYQGPCINRLCSHLSGTSNADCEAHLPNSNCITNGLICIIGPKTCNQFRGNDQTCSKFIASNGPCKASTLSIQAVPCTPRLCYEAPNSYKTNQQCETYHPSCVTNGRGCQSSITSCSEYQNKLGCDANSQCLWTTFCKMTSNTCTSLASSGPSVCVNNSSKRCSWNALKAICQDYECTDYEATLNTHDACMKASNNLCTTTGAGCIVYSTCNTYTSATTCAAASTIESSKKCTWENAKCRQQQCKDLKGKNDDECNSPLLGCKSNGKNCIGPKYSCSDFNGSQTLCQIDSAGQHCLYVNGMCYAYNNCTDIIEPTKAICSSLNCIVGTITCIPLNQCSQYNQQISCYMGINKTVCGWLPTEKCIEFSKCSDVAGTTLEDCKNWNSSCITDGNVCIPIGECSLYIKQITCNYDQASNVCHWTGNACRLKQCSDFQGTSDDVCSKLIVKEGLCTTDGTKCAIRATCSSYDSQEACTIGLDGIPCHYNQFTQSCRQQECTDLIGTTNDQCKIPKKACVSNGKNCINKGTCSSYKNQISCSGGGSDNSVCVFTASSTDPQTGSCVAFTSCENANNNRETCISNKSCRYLDQTNKCEVIDCATFNGQGAVKCNPIPNFDGKTFTICVPSANGCALGDPTNLSQNDCYSTITRYAFTWNESTNKCQSCRGLVAANNSSVNNQNDTIEGGQVLKMIFALMILGTMI